VPTNNDCGESLLFSFDAKRECQIFRRISEMLASEKAGIVYFEFLYYKNSANGIESGNIC
jgi:hypothetical protein